MFLSFVLLLSVVEIRSVKELPPGKMSHVQSSPLWKPILRHGLTETRESTLTKLDQVCFDLLDQLLTPPRHPTRTLLCSYTLSLVSLSTDTQLEP